MNDIISQKEWMSSVVLRRRVAITCFGTAESDKEEAMSPVAPRSSPRLTHPLSPHMDYFFYQLINHPPCLRVQLRRCTCHLSFKSTSPLSSFHPSMFITMRLLFRSPSFSSASWPAPLYSPACSELSGMWVHNGKYIT